MARVKTIQGEEKSEDCVCPRCNCKHKKKIYWTGRRDIPIKILCRVCKSVSEKVWVIDEILKAKGSLHIPP